MWCTFPAILRAAARIWVRSIMVAGCYRSSGRGPHAVMLFGAADLRPSLSAQKTTETDPGRSVFFSEWE